MALPLEKTEDDKFSLATSQNFNSWLSEIGGSITFSTYQVGKVLFLGLNEQKTLSVFERTFPRSMGIGLSKDNQSLLLATKTQIYSFDNVVPQGKLHDGYDALYSPHQSWITGDVDVHDIAFGEDSEPVFISTLFNCIATVSPGYSFKPIWRPSFVSAYVAQDRCHLNGMAMKNGAPKYVTCVSTSDVANGWRDDRDGGGVVIDVETNEIVVEGLSMPHSPRLHNGRLWILNSGRGEFGWIDVEAGVFQPIAFCPGFARGLTFVGKYAIIGLSEPRDGKTFGDLPLQDLMRSKNTDARCGLHVVDIETGETVEWLRIEGVIAELYDVGFLRGIKRPSAIGLIGPEVQRTISIHP